MDKEQDLIKKIQSSMQDFSKGQKLIANFIINHYDKAAYMTAARLGEEVGVSESTVVRFAMKLDLTVIPNFKKFYEK
ncbi:transcriptional regulator [Acetivibrio straminisolvens JCM 21531]|uniref:Transcriptional regulator n=1 Tax=Acetivibrio straminisolvens JCM 21531 TaxID=1294263 RepID=W4V8H0_9FIRM|nr:transcriptional regulator [Acetivibrio straminisolvens JCM 21531]